MLHLLTGQVSQQGKTVEIVPTDPTSGPEPGESKAGKADFQTVFTRAAGVATMKVASLTTDDVDGAEDLPLPPDVSDHRDADLPRGKTETSYAPASDKSESVGMEDTSLPDLPNVASWASKAGSDREVTGQSTSIAPVRTTSVTANDPARPDREELHLQAEETSNTGLETGRVENAISREGRSLTSAVPTLHGAPDAAGRIPSHAIPAQLAGRPATAASPSMPPLALQTEYSPERNPARAAPDFTEQRITAPVRPVDPGTVFHPVPVRTQSGSGQGWFRPAEAIAAAKTVPAAAGQAMSKASKGDLSGPQLQPEARPVPPIFAQARIPADLGSPRTQVPHPSGDLPAIAADVAVSFNAHAKHAGMPAAGILGTSILPDAPSRGLLAFPQGNAPRVEPELLDPRSTASRSGGEISDRGMPWPAGQAASVAPGTMLVPTPTAEPAMPQPAIGIAPVPATPSATKPTPALAREIPPVPSQAAMPVRIDRRHAEPEIPAAPKAAHAMKSPDVPGQGAAPERLAAASQASAIRQDSPQPANALFLPPGSEERVQWQTETLSFAPVSAASSAGHGTSQALSPGFFHHPGLPQHIIRQLSSAFRSGAEKSADLLLNPAELGRVRISLVTAETGITVNIVADRPETLELLRRHSDQLAQEFLDIGFETTAFAFGHNTGGGDQARTHGRNPEAQASGPTRSEADGDAIPGSQAAVDSIIDLDRVDIRL